MNPTPLEILATTLFVIAVIHTFCVSQFQKIAHHYPEGSVGENLFHFLGEVEAVFGIWSLVFFIGILAMNGNHEAVAYLEGRNFTEPAFVFVIMCMAGTRPLIRMVESMIFKVSNMIPGNHRLTFFFTCLSLGPLMGSFITEPAAMTLCALILLENYYKKGMSKKLKYATIGVLFVNVSIGGTLTHFAAPPVLMVAAKWGLDIGYMFSHFGYKAIVACCINAGVLCFLFKDELCGTVKESLPGKAEMSAPFWVLAFHIVFLALTVFYAHHMAVFMGIFLFFLGFVKVTNEFQDPIPVVPSLMVGFFLGGLVVLGGLQAWWLQPLLTQMGDIALYFGATALTAVTDNAALTYLGSLVEGLSETAKYSLLAGAVTGGGLTVIANAPNPAGYGILKETFGQDGVSPLGLLMGALGPTVVTIICFELLPNLGF